MKRPTNYLFFYCLLYLVFYGCEFLTFKHDPESGPFPYKFKIVYEIDKNSIFMDLNNDGRDECLVVINEKLPQSSPPSRLQIRDNDFRLIEEVPFNGIINKPYNFDWSGDGVDEIAVPYVRNDTLFLRMLDQKGVILKEAPLFTGQARKDSSGFYPWLGNISELLFTDLDGDRTNELLVFPSEGHARAPRGVFVYAGQSLQLLWKYEIGPSVNSANLININEDEILEILIATAAPCNGNKVNDTDDEHSYLFMINHQGKLLWYREFGGRYSSVISQVVDVEKDGTADIYVFFSKGHDPESISRLEIINPVNGRPLRSRSFPLVEAGCAIVQTDRNPDKEFLTFDRSGRFILLNGRFEEIRSQKIKSLVGKVISCEDLDGDGLEEIFAGPAVGRGTFWLDNNLKIRAKYSMKLNNSFAGIQVYHRRNASPLLAMFDDKIGLLVSLERNPRYIISYYGSTLAIVLGLVILVGLIGYSLRFHNKSKYFYQIFEKTVALRLEPTFVIDHNKRITFANAPARALLQLDESHLPISLSSISLNNPEMVSWLTALVKCDAVRQEKQIKINGGNSHTLQLVAEPLEDTGHDRPHWLVVFQEATLQAELKKAQTLVAVAQRIAHDIKNPLTSILLTLQRLQMEYSESDSLNAKKYDQYTEKIIERINSLRRMSRGFMKFLNLGKLNLQPTDINAFIENLFVHSTIELPKDIQLLNKFTPDLPTIHLDQEQAQILLENLVTNAVNAMPKGGTFSICTGLASNLQFDNSKELPQDFITIEALDTGIGIPSDLKEKLFQPFTKGTHSGTGLGLTIVKKIVEEHKGYIEFNSEEGTGTAFLIYLPVA